MLKLRKEIKTSEEGRDEWLQLIVAAAAAAAAATRRSGSASGETLASPTD